MTAMTFDWTGTHYLENKIILEVGWAPSQAEFKWKSCRWSTSTFMNTSWKQNAATYPLKPVPLAQPEGALCASDPGRTHWKSKLQLGHCAAREPGCSPVLTATDRKAARYPSTGEGYAAFQGKEACGSFKGALVANQLVASLQTPSQRTKLAAGHLQLNAQWQVLAGPGVMLKVGHCQQTKNV